MNINEVLNFALANNLSAFTQKVFHTVSPGIKYSHNWHIDCIADYLNAMEAGEIQDLIINMPPRFMKSISVSVAWTAFLLGRDPKRKIICASYAARLSENLSMDTRNVIQSDWFPNVFPNCTLAPDQNQKTWFKTTENGVRYAPSVGGTVTGFGGDYLILDDPLNPEEAYSPKERETANRWIEGSFSSRANDEKTVRKVLVMQRLHEDDPAGRLIERNPSVCLLKLPVIFEKRTLISTPSSLYEVDNGEFLHEERFGASEFEKRSKSMSAYDFAGQYMQNPAPPEGGIIKNSWYRFYDEKPNNISCLVHSWDTALSNTASSDYSVCTTWAIAKDGYYLLRVFREKVEFPDLLKAFKRLYNIDTPDYVLIENKGSGTSLIQTGRAETRAPIIEITPHRDKITRLSAVTTFFETGRVFFPKTGTHAEEILHEFQMFPNGRHDDIVDSCSQFLNFVRNREDIFKKDDWQDSPRAAKVGFKKTDNNYLY